MYESRLRENLPGVQDAIEEAALRSGRGGSDVTLVAVTKAHPPEAIKAALAVGVLDLGENRVEELEAKVQIFGREDPIWHLVGHVQSRKARQAVQNAELLHSLDTLKLARKLSGFAAEVGTRLKVLVQVNMSGEEAKSGFDPSQAQEALHQILEMQGLDVRGLMTMAPFVDDERVLRKAFSGLRGIHENAGELPGYTGRVLSMGMTNDFELAVEEGSTMVRIGTALFGERPR